MKNVSFFLLLFLINSCSSKLVEPLQQIQDQEFGTAWTELKNYPVDIGRTDDLHFFDPQTGFVINSQGYLSFTEDGGESWEIFHRNRGTFYRCITFKNRKEGWLGTIGPDDPALHSRDSIALYETKDGGRNWKPVEFIGPDPKGLCGLQKVTDDFIVGCGRVRGPSYFIKTNDGGKNWYSYDLNHLAGSLIAAHFFDEQHGFLIGGTTRDKKNCRSLVLETMDGGTTWDTIYLSEQKGEYPWKFSFTSKEKGFISIQRNVKDGRFYHLQTTDGGKNWKEVEHTDEYYYVQGIGFINENLGWMGGSRTWNYETRDGGKNWKKVRDIGDGLNNFQFFGDSLAYGVGFGVYKYLNKKLERKPIVEEFNSDGQIISRTHFRNGKKNGIAQTFYTSTEKPTLASSGKYKDNIKVGTWTYYDKKGIVAKRIKMKNGLAKVSNKVLKTYAGNYKTDDGIIRKITYKKGQLFAQRGEGQLRELYPETDTQFFYGFDAKIKIEFIKDQKGQVTQTRLEQRGNVVFSEKIK